MRSSFATPLELFHAMAGRRPDASVSFGTFVRYAAMLARPLRHAEAASAFHGLDANDDGRVSSEEFLGAFFLQRFFVAPATLRAVGAVNVAAPTTTLMPFEPLPVAPSDPVQEFSTLDANFDGVVDRREFQQRLQLLESAPIGEAVGPAFAELDSNGDEVVSFHEFAQGKEAMLRAMDVIVTWDRDRDGALDVSEFTDGTAALDPPVAWQDARSIFTAFDVDGDMRLRAPEMERALAAARRPVATA